MKKFRAEELMILRRLKALSLEIQQVASDGCFPEGLLGKVIFLLSNLKHSNSEELQKIALIQDHLHPQMTLRHFQNFMVPVERILGSALSDDEFLVTSQDRLQKPPEKVPLVLVLDNLRSAFNVGSIFRLADGVGVREIHLCGYTPLPDIKTSLGTVDVLESKRWEHLDECLAELKTRGLLICAFETAENSKSLFEFQFAGPTALVFGNERFGLAPEDLRRADQVLSIPMSGVKNSLNVANAVAIAAYEWKRQWNLSVTKP